jgi:hypothetical protein
MQKVEAAVVNILHDKASTAIERGRHPLSESERPAATPSKWMRNADAVPHPATQTPPSKEDRNPFRASANRLF